jgi:flagellar protein FliT
MSETAQIFESYEQLLRQSKCMLELARSQDWAGLVQERSRGLVDIERLRQLEAKASLGSEERQRKVELLEQILELDVEIRAHLVARQNELGSLIMTSQRQRQLNRAYRSGTVTVQAAKRFDKGSL